MGIKHRMLLLIKPFLLWGYRLLGVSKIAEARTGNLQDLPADITHCLILGASVTYTVNPVLKERLDEAIALHHLRPNLCFVLSGTLRHNDYYSDVDVMKQYLQRHSTISDEQLILDYDGYTTLQSFLSWQRQGLPARMCVITNAFHMPRALYIATSLGLDAYGFRLPAYVGTIQKYYEDRELAAVYKACVLLVYYRHVNNKRGIL